MTRILATTLSLLALTKACALGQVATPATPVAAPATAAPANPVATRTKGAIFRTEVDMGFNALDKRAMGKALGGDSALANAQILCAMGHCHRFYHRSDGPVVRPSLEALLRARAADGSFGAGDDAAKLATTAWVVDALEIMDADGFADEIATARKWLADRRSTDSPWQQAVSAVLGDVRADVFPQHLAKEQGEQARTAYAAPAEVDPAKLAVAMVRLVACQDANRKLDGAQAPQASTFQPSQQRGLDYLLTQAKDGVCMVTDNGKSVPEASITAFTMLALQTKPRELRTKQEQAVIDQGMRWLLAHQNEDGSFGDTVLNYTTSVVVGALAKWNDPAVRPAMDKAQKFILKCQFLEANGYQPSDRDYGAMGYGGMSSRRADLSNTNFALQALKDSGLPPDHEAFAKALVFLQRTQNLKATNDFSGKVPDPDNQGRILDATSGDDGGAVYYPGNSAAGYIVLPDGKSVPRSYGSMTYALLKAYTLAGLKGDDARVRAAVQWIQSNWTLAENPGADPTLGEKAKYQGLYYYYMILAQALDLASVKEVTAIGKDGKPAPLDWRKALRTHLEGMQAKDGSWLNDKNSRWMEGREVLCTCYVMVALEHCK